MEGRGGDVEVEVEVGVELKKEETETVLCQSKWKDGCLLERVSANLIC